MSFFLRDSLPIRNPTWAIETTIQIPLIRTDTSVFTLLSTCALVLRLVIRLNRLFTVKSDVNSRDVQEEQLQIFRAVEGALQSAGMEGKSCLLRTICELQHMPIGGYSIIGEIVTLLLTPKSGDSDFLADYIEAQRWGQSAEETRSCAAKYRACPMSLFNLFRSEDVEEPQHHQQAHTFHEPNCDNCANDKKKRRPVHSGKDGKGDVEAENQIHHSLERDNYMEEPFENEARFL